MKDMIKPFAYQNRNIIDNNKEDYGRNEMDI